MNEAIKILNFAIASIQQRVWEVEGMAKQELDAGHFLLHEKWQCRCAGVKDALAILQNQVEAHTPPPKQDDAERFMQNVKP